MTITIVNTQTHTRRGSEVRTPVMMSNLDILSMLPVDLGSVDIIKLKQTNIKK